MSIRGSVFDSDTGQPLSGVRVDATALAPPGIRLWTDPWPEFGGRLPIRTDQVSVAANTVIEVNTVAAECGPLLCHGTLRASRTVPSLLSCHGSLVLHHGILDYGRLNDRIVMDAAIRFYLDESRYVGGGDFDHNMAPITDVGLWAFHDARLFVHGIYRDAWAPLLVSAMRGTDRVSVDPAYAMGWAVGDLLIVGGTNLPRNRPDDFQDERRRIVAVLGPGEFRLDAPLGFDHDVHREPWTDAHGDPYIEVMAGKVANLTSNIRFEAASPDHRPHIMFHDEAKFFVEDLAVIGFSPRARVNPMARYAWHPHRQTNGSRGSYMRRTRLIDGQGNGLVNHDSWGISYEDIVVYGQARASMFPNVSNNKAVHLEIEMETIIVPGSQLQHHSADDCRFDRVLVGGWGGSPIGDDYRNAGFWLGGARNCVLVGCCAFGGTGGSRSSAFHWPEAEGGSQDTPHCYKIEANSMEIAGLHGWQNIAPTGLRDRIIDILLWRHGNAGFFWGAYTQRFWFHHLRCLGNGVAQISHASADIGERGWGITDFLADGMGVGETGIEVRTYTIASTVDSLYEDGVVRRNPVNVRHSQFPDLGEISKVQFARVIWDNVPILFDGVSDPPEGSRLKFRDQRGLPRPANFTLARRNETVPGSVDDLQYNARRIDGPIADPRPVPPRVGWVSPSDEIMATGTVTLQVSTDATAVEFYEANRVLATVPVSGGRASLVFDMAMHPFRRAYLWAEVERDGAVRATRVIRVRKS